MRFGIDKINGWFAFWIILFQLIPFQYGWSNEIKFSHVGLEQGLSQIAAMCLHQDSIGRVWIGTREGLNCYDGTSMTTYHAESGNPYSLLGHIVYKIVEQNNHLWILTDVGLSRLNLETLQIERYSIGASNDIILYNGELIIAKNSGIYRLNQTQKILESSGWNLPENLNVLCLFKDSNNRFFIGTRDQGIYLYEPQKSASRNIHSASATCFFEDKKHSYWIGTDQSGVFLLNDSLKTIGHFQRNRINGLTHNNIRKITDDHHGNIWIGTFLGVTIFNPSDQSFRHLKHDAGDPHSICHNSIYDILKGSQETMWLGTYFGGVSYSHLNPDIYNRYYYPGREKNQISFPVVGKIKEDHDGNIWIGTEGGGLNLYNKKTGQFTYFSTETEKFKLSGNNVKDFCFDDQGIIYATIHLGGLNKINTQTGEVKHYQHREGDTTSIHTDRVTDIIHFGSNYLIGGFGGVSMFNPETERFSPFRIGYTGIVHCIYEDHSGNLWFGTENNGVYRYNIDKREGKWFLHNENDPGSISSNNISQVFEDAQSNLWFATLGGGLCMLHRESETFTTYTKAQNHLLSDFVFGIQQSGRGYLWVSTRKGLTKFDRVSNRFYHHDYTHGFPLKELNISSLLLTKDGELYIGGIDGLVSMNEDAIFKSPEPVSLFLSRLTVNNQEVKPLEPSGILKKVLNNTPALILKPKHTTFSIHYAAPGYNPAGNLVFQHRLEGYDRDWVESAQFLGNYTNVSPGSYHFRVRCLNAFDRAVIAEKSLMVSVKPPIYLTWYAYLAYFILFASALLWLQHNYRTKMKLDHQLEIEQKEKEKIQMINQAKLRFFTNISHELKTPLTLIMGSLEMIMEQQKLSPKYYNQLRIAYSNAFRLKSLVSELIDFRKQEQGHFKIVVRQENLIPFIEEIFHAFVEFANYKQIDYRISLPKEDLKIWIDARQMQKVFFNLIGNAFKYVKPQTGKISIELNDSGSQVEIVIRDNGIGIPADQSSLIFDRFYQIENNPSNKDGQGSGIGLALSKGIVEAHGGTIGFTSEPGHGTLFFVHLKKGNTHFKPEELNDEPPTPAEEIPVSEYLPHKPTEPFNQEDPSEDRPTLLIVDDTDEVREMLSDLFAPTYRISLAASGEEAIERAMKEQPDLIISDVMMPGMSGTELCVKIKRNIQTCHIPVILLTARTALSYKLEGIETGADDYIEKPFNVKLLKARVQNLLLNRKILQKKFNSEPDFEVKSLAINQLDKKLLEKASAIINDNLSEPDFGIDDFAAAIGLGRTKLFEKIKGLTGQTPNDFIQTIRMNKAAELLVKSPELTISEIAYLVGFNSPKYFSSCFRRHFGVTPSQYTKKP